MKSESRAVMAPRAFRISRATDAGGSQDPQSKFVFDPPIDSDELFDALREEYPAIKTHTERKRKAVLDFLVREREDDLRALDMLVSHENTASSTPASRPASHQTPTGSSTWPTPESTGSVGQTSPIEVSPSAMFKSKTSASAFQVWDPTSDKPVKLHSRRRMTDQEKEEYRMRRLLGSCDSCKQKRRKCRHFLQSSSSTKHRLKKAKASKPCSSNTSPLCNNIQSTSDSGSDSSPSESIARSFSNDASSSAQSSALLNDDLFAMSDITFDQTFGVDFPLFSEAVADLDLLPLLPNDPVFSNTPAYHTSPTSQTYTNRDWSFDSNVSYDMNADWLNASIDTTFTDFSPQLSSSGLQRSPVTSQYQPPIEWTDPTIRIPYDGLLGSGTVVPDVAQGQSSRRPGRAFLSPTGRVLVRADVDQYIRQQLLSASTSPTSYADIEPTQSPHVSPQLVPTPYRDAGTPATGNYVPDMSFFRTNSPDGAALISRARPSQPAHLLSEESSPGRLPISCTLSPASSLASPLSRASVTHNSPEQTLLRVSQNAKDISSHFEPTRTAESASLPHSSSSDTFRRQAVASTGYSTSNKYHETSSGQPDKPVHTTSSHTTSAANSLGGSTLLGKPSPTDSRFIERTISSALESSKQGLQGVFTQEETAGLNKEPGLPSAVAKRSLAKKTNRILQTTEESASVTSIAQPQVNAARPGSGSETSATPSGILQVTTSEQKSTLSAAGDKPRQQPQGTPLSPATTITVSSQADGLQLAFQGPSWLAVVFGSLLLSFYVAMWSIAKANYTSLIQQAMMVSVMAVGDMRTGSLYC